MRAIWFPILALTSSIISYAGTDISTQVLLKPLQTKAERIVIGSLADISVRYESNKLITVVYVLDFSKDVFVQEPILLQVRLCGDQLAGLGPAVHTNITLIYDTASQSRLTGCLKLISSESWHDNSEWQTITFTPDNITNRSRHFDKHNLKTVGGAFGK
jgi:hypothetical protein